MFIGLVATRLFEGFFTIQRLKIFETGGVAGSKSNVAGGVFIIENRLKDQPASGYRRVIIKKRADL